MPTKGTVFCGNGMKHILLIGTGGTIASEITEMLMGTDVPPRKAFIHEHAHDAELDV